MNRFLATALVCAAVASGCSADKEPPMVRLCQTDFECSGNEVCFPLQGCGDPGGGLVVEVQGNTRMGQLAQDFPVSADGGFSATNNFDLKPASIKGEFVRDNTNYLSSVTVRVRGESEQIPGVVRSYQETFQKPERGAYTLPVGAGNFTVTAETSDPSVPPALSMVKVDMGAAETVSFAFSPSDKTLSVTGRLLKRTEPGPTPETPIEIPIAQAMDVQAFAAGSLRPLSQKVAVKSDGTFFLFVSAEVYTLGQFVIHATPHALIGPPVPSKAFPLDLPLNPVIRLVLGDYGDALPQASGLVKTSAGVPIKDAVVTVEGLVNGGGTFKSRAVTTDVNGEFKVDLLPPAQVDGTLTLTVVPPPTSPSGYVQRQVKPKLRAGLPLYYVDVNGGDPSMDEIRTVTCPDKITVIGSVVQPKGSTPSVGVTVIARAVERLKELQDQPLPTGETQTVTNENGRFTLELDPAVYEIDFVPGPDLPRTGRVVTVRIETDNALDAGVVSKTIDLKETELRKGRKVTGVVRVPDSMTGAFVVAPTAIVRYYRVASVGGANVSLLLSETLTDTEGNYSVMLPAK